MHILSAKTNSKAVFQFNVETLVSNHTIPLHEDASSYFGVGLRAIRDCPDHATFREKRVTTGLVGQAWGFPLFDSM